jgi:hypothetical protein
VNGIELIPMGIRAITKRAERIKTLVKNKEE